MSAPPFQSTYSRNSLGSLSPCSSLGSLDDTFSSELGPGFAIIPVAKKDKENEIQKNNSTPDIEVINENATAVDDDSDDQELWEVKKIAGKKKSQGDWYYKVIWADGSSTWEPISNLEGCPIAIRDFEEEMRKKRSRRVKLEEKREKKNNKTIKAPHLRRRKAGRLPSDSEDEQNFPSDITSSGIPHGSLKTSLLASEESDDSSSVISIGDTVKIDLEEKKKLDLVKSDEAQTTLDSGDWLLSKFSQKPSKCYSCHRGPLNVDKNKKKKKKRHNQLQAEDDFNFDSSDSEFSDEPLLSCSKCCSIYHEACLPLLTQSRKRPQFSDYLIDGKFVCNKCRENKPCTTCKVINSPIEPSSEPKKLFRCSVCLVSGHWECVGKQIVEAYESLSNGKDSETLDRMELNEAFDEMSLTFMCATCLMHSNKVDRILTFRASENGTEYLVKFKNMSYRALTWVKEDWIRGTHVHLFRSFQRTVNQAPHLWPKSETEAISSNWTRVDKILDVSKENYFIKWMGLPYTEATWESKLDPSTDADFARALTLYEQCENLGSEITQLNATAKLKDLRPNPKSFQLLTEQPKELAGGTLKSYQLEGVNWLLGNWCARTPCILADEMGLGKTIQVISFLVQLYHQYSRFPFLLVVPNSTLDNWSRELSVWAPQFLVVVSTGTREDREMIRKYDIFKSSSSKAIKSHIVLTSYESVLLNPTFKTVQWDCLIVDEGHRLKNNKSKLFNFLKEFKVAHKILLTGTPLQNNIHELFNLMNFMDPEQFSDTDELSLKFNMEGGDEETKKKIDELHALLRPHFLRRVKSDVLKDLPPKAEILVPVRMTQLQKELIKDIYSSNFELLKALCKNAGMSKNVKSSFIRSSSLMNILMQCRKVLSHPFLLPEVEEGLGVLDKPDAIHKRLVESGGKLELLSQMLTKLKAEGHKVLIFSQFKTTLDILEDFLTGCEWDYCRFDGDTTRSLRQEYIDTFNSTPEKFVFLLTTRAGGVGLNLSSADTVIIYDSDWNPHQDLQAIARCHRIGQTRPVLAFRLMTVGSVEEKMVSVGIKKLALDHVVVQKMKDSSVDDHDLVELLRFGAKALFEEDSGQFQKYSDEELNRLLDRSQAKSYTSNSSEKVASNAMSSGSSPTLTNVNGNANAGFGFAKVWLEKKMDGSELENVEEDWEQLLNKLRKETSQNEETNGRRKRKAVNYIMVSSLSPKKQKQNTDTGSPNSYLDSDASFDLMNEPDSDQNEFFLDEHELNTELHDLLDGPIPNPTLSEPPLPSTGSIPQPRLNPNPSGQSTAGSTVEAKNTFHARKGRKSVTKKMNHDSKKDEKTSTNGQTLSPLTNYPKATSLLSNNSFSKQSVSPYLFAGNQEHLSGQIPSLVPPGPEKIPQTPGGLTAYTFGQQSPCWICSGSIYSSISYHLPIQCPALKDRDFLLNRLRVFYAQSPESSRPAQLFLQKMIQRSSPALCLICQSVFHFDIAQCPSSRNITALVAARDRILSTRQKNTTWLEDLEKIEALIRHTLNEYYQQNVSAQKK